ncbi:MAG TPA: hypothetical protein VFD44_03460 [Hanamia sp.]|jgi:hypothetical protein|nr:hypothetical protein [Hanamia sp.]
MTLPQKERSSGSAINFINDNKQQARTKFNTAFFDPSEKAATYHRYRVTGKEDLQLNEDTDERVFKWKVPL